MSRTLNGLGNIGGGFNLISSYNLADIVDPQEARINLGLLGSLTTNSPYLSISSSFDGTQNAVISFSGDSFVIKDAYGDFSAGKITLTDQLKCNSIDAYNEDSISFNMKNLVNISTVYCAGLQTTEATCTTLVCNSFTTLPEHFNQMYFNTNNLLDIANVNIDGNLDVMGNSTFASLFTNSIDCLGPTISCNLKDFEAMGSVSAAALLTPALSISPGGKLNTNSINALVPGSSIIFYNFANAQIASMSNTGLLACSGLNAGGSNVTNVRNITKLLWSNTVASTQQPASNITTLTPLPSLSYTLAANINYVRYNIPFVYNGETGIRYTFHLSAMTAGGTLALTLRFSGPDGVIITPITAFNVVASTSLNTSVSVLFDLSTNPHSLSINRVYILSILDRSAAALTYTIVAPEVCAVY